MSKIVKKKINKNKNTEAKFILSASFLHPVVPMSEKKNKCKKISKIVLKNT
jgi:hypothetical protein